MVVNTIVENHSVNSQLRCGDFVKDSNELPLVVEDEISASLIRRVSLLGSISYRWADELQKISKNEFEELVKGVCLNVNNS